MTVFESLLNHDFIHTGRRRTPDGQGGWPIDEIELEPVRGRIRPVSSSEREVAMLEERVITHVFYCLASEDIVRGDHLSYGGLIVEVEGIREPSKAGEHLEIDCRERQPEQSREEEGS